MEWGAFLISGTALWRLVKIDSTHLHPNRLIPALFGRIAFDTHERTQKRLFPR